MRHTAFWILCVFGFLNATLHQANADWVELLNNDLVQGEVVSLDGTSLKLKSANFGEMTIPRDKVKIIGFGERVAPAVTPAVVPAVGQKSLKLSSEIPSLENGQLSQLFHEALGSGGVTDLQQKINSTRDELKNLRRDFKSTDELDALDSYIQIFDFFGKLSAGGGVAKPQRAPKPVQQESQTQPQAKP